MGVVRGSVHDLAVGVVVVVGLILPTDHTPAGVAWLGGSDEEAKLGRRS